MLYAYRQFVEVFEMLTLPEHLISPLVFIRGSCCPVICVSLFYVYSLVFWILSFDCSFCLIA